MGSENRTRLCSLQILVRHHSSDIYTVRLSVNEAKKIEVSVKFSCTAKLDPSKARIWCAIRNERSSCDLLGIEARSAMSAYVSCDDIDLGKRLGGGAYLDFSLSSEIFPSAMEQFSREHITGQRLQSRNITISFYRTIPKHRTSSISEMNTLFPSKEFVAR